MALVDRYGITRVIFETMYLHSIKNLPTALCPLSVLEPNYLTDAVLGEMMETVVRHREGIGDIQGGEVVMAEAPAIFSNPFSQGEYR